ncbi:uncharacterized protein BP5553_03164 [Venustampulla echinocandica]|uniref:Origin recognition complex subunit 4 n=1 Tax=Venustampulla echinocandica TaxID=2656787 RepID=A0A370TTI8_9HELO|nr:uncharacterized protein BP5553_03164 [Venustampulla echinocandica]RDL38824.1 hypothetical protein BP5553_03164 [Venustampulla echinocandica]
MAPASPAVTRKRSRALLVDEALDELSPQKEKSGTPGLGSLKRRKLNTKASSSGSEGRWGSIGQKFSGLSGLFGLGDGNGKETLDNADDVDELVGDRDIWQVDSTENEASPRVKKSNGETKSTRDTTNVMSQTTKPRRQQNLKANEPDNDIWEVEASEEDMASNSGAHRHRGRGKIDPKKSMLAPAPMAKGPDPSLKRPRGRPRKSDILRKAKADSRQETRQRMVSQNLEVADAPNGRESGRTSDETSPQSGSELAPSSITARRIRGDKEAGTPGPIQRAPKGILTPTKNMGKRLGKSVTFEQKGGELDLGFKDLPSSANRREQKASLVVSSSLDSRRTPDNQVQFAATGSNQSAQSTEDMSRTAAEDDSSDRSDEIVCQACSGLRSRKGNQILLCDGCDFSVHQKCYGVPVIPEGDWYCKECRPSSEAEMEVDMINGTGIATAESNIPDIVGLEVHLKKIQRTLLDRLTGQKRIRLRGHDEQMQKVHQVVEQTVLAGEGNSMLVIGGRGCGKTTLVESVISDISTDHREKFHVVRLNGFIHTDDKVALREIWRQLGREMDVEGDLATKTSNHADTLATLLALLSHPSEISGSSSEQIAKSVIFVLDEFDLFTTHARQTLLYNLFDIAQARKAPIAVLGLTTRVDVVESLEKRVKSRFSHRYVYLSLARSLPMFWEICKQGLTVDAGEVDVELGPEQPGQKEFLLFWNAMVDDLYTNDDHFKHYLQSYFYRNKSVPAFFGSCILPIASLSPSSLPLASRAFLSSALSVSPPDSKLHILPGLSELELALLIAAARLDIILDTDTCNFAMAYDEYCSLTSRHKIQTSSTGVAALGSSTKVWGKDVALGAWEKLAAYELLVPAGIGGGGGRDFGIAGRMMKVDVGLEEITGSLDGLAGVMAKWCREI